MLLGLVGGHDVCVRVCISWWLGFGFILLGLVLRYLVVVQKEKFGCDGIGYGYMYVCMLEMEMDIRLHMPTMMLVVMSC